MFDLNELQKLLEMISEKKIKTESVSERELILFIRMLHKILAGKTKIKQQPIIEASNKIYKLLDKTGKYSIAFAKAKDFFVQELKNFYAEEWQSVKLDEINDPYLKGLLDKANKAATRFNEANTKLEDLRGKFSTALTQQVGYDWNEWDWNECTYLTHKQMCEGAAYLSNAINHPWIGDHEVQLDEESLANLMYLDQEQLDAIARWEKDNAENYLEGQIRKLESAREGKNVN